MPTWRRPHARAAGIRDTGRTEAMAVTYTWKGTGTTWATPGNWNRSSGPSKYPGQTPGGTDIAVIDSTGSYSVEYNTTGVTIASLTINDSGATLYFDAS